MRPHILACVALLLASFGGCSSDRSGPFFFLDHVDGASKSFDASRFRSSRPDEALVLAMTFDADTRRALAPPAPSTLSFTVDVPLDPVMRFSIGVSTMGAPTLAAPVDFALNIDHVPVFVDTIKRAKPNQWFDRDADLTPWAGQRVEITFETKTHSTDASILPLWGYPVLASSAPRAEMAKLILISIDCLRASHVGVYGYERDTTPHLDALARDGVVFETAVSTSSYTHPTHMSMLTGLPPAIHGATRTRHLSKEVAFLPELLTDAGYRADGVVSADFLSQSFGFERGFDTYQYLIDPGADVLVDRALTALNRGEGQRQFLFFHLFDPHLPYAPPHDFLARFGPRPPDISRLNRKLLLKTPPSDENEIQHAKDLYDAEIAYMDQELGRFLDALKKRGLYDSSLIIVTADHGEAFREHGYWEHGQTLYEEMVRIPMIVKWPKNSAIPTGSRVETLVSQTDIFPTLLDAAGLPSQSEWATNLRDLVGESTAQSSRTAVIEVRWDPLPTRGAWMLVAFRRQSSKYIATLKSPTTEGLYHGPVVKEELYDLSIDPGEKNNLIERVEPATRRSYREQLRAYLAEGHRLLAERSGEDVVLDETVRRNLEALGYIQR